MKIRSKLLLSYLALVGIVIVVIGLGLPRLIRDTGYRTEQRRLQTMADGFAKLAAERLTNRRTLAPVGPNIKEAFTFFDDLLASEIVAIVDGQGVVLRSTKRAFEGTTIPSEVLTRGPRIRFMAAPPTIDGIGPVLVATAPLSRDLPLLRPYSVVVLRPEAEMAEGVRLFAQRLSLGILILLGAALASALLISQGLVRRLRGTGDAARAIAEGDLAQRAPAHGGDEIADLAGHFNQMAERVQALVEGLRRSQSAQHDLLIMVSHEVRTPLTSIQGFAEALRDGVVRNEERRQRYYEIIAAESARLSRLTTDLFDVAKLEAGQAEIQFQPVDLEGWLGSAAEGLQAIATDQEVQVALVIDPALQGAAVWGDRDRLQQVLGNLTANALRFAPAGTTVTIGARPFGPRVRVTVSDQGPGLTATEQQKVFERFYQGRQVGAHKGAGLGLAIAKSLVGAHGGQIGVESVPGQGATFWFDLQRYAEQ
ncbi:MAG TPA: HAMP domain-containing sensor histidine kinase [Symbiobacteriaceae bacterium]|nr:HAMP domain-containing sensor histidine kinase [Symbiobacteriaceae bacterium]